MRPRMHFAMRATLRLPRPPIGLALTATQSTAVRHSSYVSADEFVKEFIGTQQRSHKKDHETKKPSSPKLRRVKVNKLIQKVPAKSLSWLLIRDRAPPVSIAKKPPSEDGGVGAAPRLNITYQDNRISTNPKPWNNPAQRWPEKPLSVFSRQRALNLHRLPFATTTQDIIRSIDNAVREKKVDFRSARIQDIVIRPRSDTPEEVDAVVDFLHPLGAQTIHKLAVQGKFKVQDVVPEASLRDNKDPSEMPQPSEDEVIEQLSTQNRAEVFKSPEYRKVVRRTHLIYN